MRRTVLLLWLLLAALPALAATIVTPAMDETIHANDGIVPVIVAGLKPGTPLRAVLDGKVRATFSAPAVELHEVFRGEHQLVVEVLDRDGRVVGRTPGVTFHVWHASRLNPPPR